MSIPEARRMEHSTKQRAQTMLDEGAAAAERGCVSNSGTVSQLGGETHEALETA